MRRWKKLTGSKLATRDNLVEKFYELEDLRARLNDGGTDVRDDAPYCRFVAAPPDEHELEVRGLENKTACRRSSGSYTPDTTGPCRLPKVEGP